MTPPASSSRPRPGGSGRDQPQAPTRDRFGEAERSEPIRVLLVDDHVVVRRGLRAFVDTEPELEVVGEAGDGLRAIDLLTRWRTLGESLPDVVLMDLRMPGMDGTEATERIVAGFPGVHVVVLTSFGEVERVHNALEAGAAGYLLKDAEPGEVAEAVRAAARGEVHLDSAVAGQLVRRISAPRVGLNALTVREREILALVAEGHPNRTIAERLVISERTARTHVSNVLGKLQLSSRTQAALFAIREGLIPPPG